MNYNFFDIILRALKAQGDNLKQQVIRITKVTSKLVTRILTFVRNTITSFLRAPQSREDYVGAGRYLLSKRLVFMCIAAFLGAVTVCVCVIYPWMDGRLWVSHMELNSEKFLSFSGKAQVYDSGGVTIYQGDMVDGALTGTGRQYDTDGILLYEGNFEDGQYSGQGRYYIAHVLRYDGAFSNNLYQGEGNLYNQDSRLIYSGPFVAGLRSGIGTAYNPETGKKSYFGSYAEDKKEGNGTAFAQDGETIVYEGSFALDVYAGQGKLYENGKLRYAGSFAEGVFSGDGVLYDADSGTMLYEGQFQNGQYSGEGKLYDPDSGSLLYSGTFANGRRDGSGAEYDSLGAVIFQGNYKDGLVDLMSYMGQDMQAFCADFGNPSTKETVDDVEVWNYPSKNLVVIAKPDIVNQVMVCWKIMSGLREEFCNIQKSSTQQDVQNVLGAPFTSLELTLPAYSQKAFAALGATVPNGATVLSEKYLQSGYYIRVYYDAPQGKAAIVEMCGL